MSSHRDVHVLTEMASDGLGARKCIAVIGIDRYVEWSPLSNAVSDASGALQLFRAVGFEEIAPPLLDEQATGDAIRALVTDDLMGLGPNDSLILFYAGHGGNRSHQVGDRTITTGYLVPVDAATSRTATWIELGSWLRSVSLLPAKHILVILDACYSGIALDPALKWRDDLHRPLGSSSALNDRPSRRIITSALGDQRALDHGPIPGHSLFTGCLIEGLSGDLSRGDLRVATGSEIGLYLQKRVRSYPNSRQTPDFGAFDLDERGKMIIPLLGRGGVLVEEERTGHTDGWLPIDTDPEPSSIHPSASLVNTEVDPEPMGARQEAANTEFDTDPSWEYRSLSSTPGEPPPCSPEGLGSQETSPDQDEAAIRSNERRRLRSISSLFGRVVRDLLGRRRLG